MAVLVPHLVVARERGEAAGGPPAGDTTVAAYGDTVPFRHAEHTDVGCLECHSTEEAHGTVTVTSIRGCRSCHHSGSNAEPCTRCHGRAEPGRVRAYTVSRDLSMSVGSVRGRELSFEHSEHDTVACASCHGGADGTDLSAASVQCAECHDEHHGVDVRCASCHREAAEGTHTLAVHATCSGSGCHDSAALPVTAGSMARSPRNVCLSCHRDQVDHRPGERCARCHLLPAGDDAAATEGGDGP